MLFATALGFRVPFTVVRVARAVVLGRPSLRGGHFDLLRGQLLAAPLALALALLAVPAALLPGGLAGRGCCLGPQSGAAMMGSQAAFAADLRHVLAVAAHLFAAFAPRGGSFMLIPFVRSTSFVSRPAAHRSNLAALIFVHSSKTASFSHDSPPSLWFPSH